MPLNRHSTAPTAASLHHGSWASPASSTPMLAARAQAHGPVLIISPMTTASPASGRSQPRSGPSRRNTRSTTSAPRPISHGIQESPANGQSSRAAASVATPAAPRGERVNRRQLNRGRRRSSGGGGGPGGGGLGGSGSAGEA